MREFLAQGYEAYLMAAICAAGILGELIAGHVYRRLNRQAGRIVYAKHPFFKKLRMEYEKACQIGAGMLDGRVFVQKKLYTYRVLGIHLTSLANAAVIAGLFCVTIGMISMFGGIWYQFSIQEILLPAVGGAAVWMGLWCFHLLANAAGKARILEVQIQDYFMNAAGWRGQMVRDQKERDGAKEPSGAEYSGKSSRNRAREIADLKKSLEQIAAAREKIQEAGKDSDRDPKALSGQAMVLSEDQEHLIQEILQEYFD